MNPSIFRWLAPASVVLASLLGPLPRAYAQPSAVVISNVGVIPMDRERVLERQTVVVRGTRIVYLGDSAGVPRIADAARVDATGKYLIPGLADTHVHLLSDAGFPDSLAADELMVMVANGITAVRVMIGTPEHLEVRRAEREGRILGPTLWVASPQLAGRSFGSPFNGFVVTNPQEGRAAVRAAKQAGYDFVKLTFFISRAVYDAVIDEAQAVGLRVLGHVDPEVGLDRALAAGQHVEHLDGYLEALVPDSATFRGSVSGVQVWQRRNWISLDYLDTAKIPDLARATAKSGTFTSPTLTFLRLAFGVGQSDEEIRARPDWRFVPARLRAEWEGPRSAFWTDPPTAERRQRFVNLRNQLVKAIRNAGGRIMAGSDAPEWFLMYGWTLHRELESLVAAGLTPYQALEAATKNPAEFFGAADSTGTLGTGKVADFVLLDGNPLADIRQTRQIAGVARRGVWLSKSRIAAELDRIRTRFQAAFGRPGQ